MAASAPITLVGGIDVGNGYVKGVVRAGDGVTDQIDLPSAVVSTSRSTPKVPEPDTDARRVVLEEDLFNHLAASFDSPLVSHTDLRVFGRAALSTPGSRFTQFEISGSRSKVDQELSSVLVLGVFAAAALRSHVRAMGVLPDREIVAHVRAGLNLPIAEYVAKRHAFAAQFTGADPSEPITHLVTVKNFATPVVVRLRFIDVQVLPEGASAQFAITDKGEALADALLTDLRATNPSQAEALAGVTGAQLVAVRNTVGVDVGEGTVNFPVFTDGAFNAEAATTLGSGYGTALTNALDRMSGESDLSFSNRKALADFLQSEPSVFLRGRYDRAAGYVEEESRYLADEIVARFQDVLAEVGGTTEAVYVYGGGSGPIREALRPVLQKAAGPIPVLYLDASFSRHLNREGLYLAANAAQKNSAKSGKKSQGKGAA